MKSAAKKKIVYILEMGQMGGTERQAFEIARRINQDIFQVTAYWFYTETPEGERLKALLDANKIAVTLFDNRPTKPRAMLPDVFRYARKLLHLYRYLKSERPQIVHCFLYSPSMYGGIAAACASVPCIITNRRSLGFFKDAAPHYQVLENLVNRVTDIVLVNSEAVKQDVLRRESLAPEKVRVIHNGVDLQQYAPSNQHAHQEKIALKKQALGIPEHAPVLGMVANLIPYKGHQDFLCAAAQVHVHYPEARFLCIGEDRGIQHQLEQQCQEFGIRNQVHFTGHVGNMSEFFDILDIQVSTSYEEGFSNAILEGMASGKPIVATDVGGTPEAVVHDVTGCSVPPKNPAAVAQAILDLLANPERAARFGINARKRVEEHFSMELVIHKLEQLYLQMGNFS